MRCGREAHTGISWRGGPCACWSFDALATATSSATGQAGLFRLTKHWTLVVPAVAPALDARPEARDADALLAKRALLKLANLVARQEAVHEEGDAQLAVEVRDANLDLTLGAPASQVTLEDDCPLVVGKGCVPALVLAERT